MAGSHTFNDPVFASRVSLPRAPDRKGRKLALGVALATGALLAATPLVVTAVIPNGAQPGVETVAPEPETSLVGFPGSNIELGGSVLGFKQTGDTIAVSLMASDDGRRVFVQNAAGDLLEVPVSPGQTNVTAELPAAFAASDTLTIRVD